jgi:hypothetical protein
MKSPLSAISRSNFIHWEFWNLLSEGAEGAGTSSHLVGWEGFKTPQKLKRAVGEWDHVPPSGPLQEPPPGPLGGWEGGPHPLEGQIGGWEWSLDIQTLQEAKRAVGGGGVFWCYLLPPLPVSNLLNSLCPFQTRI